MNKKILLTLLILLTAVLSASAISASDVNVTDSYATSLVDDTSDVSVPLENAADSSEISVSSDSNVDNDPSKVSLSSEEVLESENSNILSTNSNDNNLSSSDSGITVISASNEGVKSDSDVSSKIDVSKTITAKDITKYYKGSTQYTATFLDAYGNPLANTNVKITANGVTYTKKTDANGVASLSINLKPGTYKVIANNPVTGYSLTNNFKVLSTITASDISKVYQDSRKFYATFLKSDGKVLAKKTVKFKVNGKTLKVKTDSKGVASVSLKSLKQGTYKITSYNTDGLSKTNKIKVYRQVSSKIVTSKYTFLKSDSKTIKVTFLNGLGYAPGSGKVIKFTINGKTYSKRTNSKGAAYLKLPTLKAGVYTVKYRFEGSSYYKASSTSNKVVIIPSKTPTFTIKSGTSFTKGASNYFKLAVTSGAVPLQGKVVTIKIDGKTYTRTANANGLVSVAISSLAIGKHTVTYSVDKDSKVNAKSGSTSITINEKKTAGNHRGYWLFGGDMYNVKLSDLSSNGVTDIFLNYYAIEAHGKSNVESWIASAKNVGISVHIWVQSFYNGDDGWINPATNTKFVSNKLNEIKGYASIKGLAGIHLDYLRYPGTASNTPGSAAAITAFANNVKTAVKAINSNLILSCALMPEPSASISAYGQDYDALSKCMDVVVPMIYKGNYGKDSAWITSMTKYYVEHSKGASVWSGIQTYVSDKNTAKLSTAALTNDIKAALNGGASGVVLFRLGISNSVNFNTISSSATSVEPGSSAVSGNSISIKNIITGATNLKTYYASNKKLPNTVAAGGYTFTMPEFLYLMGQAIYQISTSNTKDIAIITGVSNPESPFGDSISADLSTYATVAKNVATYISSHNQAPNYASSDVGKIIYEELIDSFSRVLAYYGTNNAMPNYVTINYGSVSSGSSAITVTVSGSGLNEANKATDLSPYLSSTKNCPVGNSVIKAKVTELTKDLTTDAAKAKAIYNWVRDYVSYSFYYNTGKGAVGTYNARTGNCVDQAHLLISMFRTAGLAARYVHGTCTFSDGTFGHVWAQVLIDGKWTVADPVSSRNSLGSIANWNTKTFTLHGIYSQITF